MRDILAALKHNKVIQALCLFAVVLVLVNVLLKAHHSPAEPVIEDVSEPAYDMDEGMGLVRICELMAKNHATLRDEDGDFSDWIELENVSGEAVELTGWSISDEGDGGWVFPEIHLQPGERLLVFASGKDRPSTLHTDFKLSEGESVYLLNRAGSIIDSALCSSAGADISLALGDDGTFAACCCPTPGETNDAAGYERLQSALSAPGPLVINEAVVYAVSSALKDDEPNCDWAEIKNISSEPVMLSEYWLSDDDDNYMAWQLPETELAPGGIFLVCFDDEDEAARLNLACAPFGLSSDCESLYLSSGGALVDYAPLRGIPYGGSMGRRDGENGWFYFASPSPRADNSGGCRRVSDAPKAAAEDGIFEDVTSVQVELVSPGDIYYTLDGSAPTTESTAYTGPFTVEKTCVVRAIAVEDSALPSRPLNLSYIINEGHSLPVLSLCSDNLSAFNYMYRNGWKSTSQTGSLSFYEQGGSFTVPCRIKMHGETSLVLNKKNLRVSLNGALGQSELDYDIFGGGVTSFTDLVLRAGQDQYASIIRNELCENICLSAGSDSLIAQRNRYCVLYINGSYNGIYSLQERPNEQHYAALAGVSEKSVTVLESEVRYGTDFFDDVLLFCQTNDMRLEENYRHFCSIMDVDSLIDWIIMEGYFANQDLTYGNVRYCRSTENDGKWRLMFYDLDATLHVEYEPYYNILSWYSRNNRQVGKLIDRLMMNDSFRDRFLTRAAELFKTALSEENLLSEIDRLAAELEPEIERNHKRFWMTADTWRWNIDYLRELAQNGNWIQKCIDNLTDIFNLTAEQSRMYFG